MNIRSDYLTIALHPDVRKLIIQRAVRRLRRHSKEFDTLVIRGASGLLIAPAVADGLHKHLTLVRKHGESTHSKESIEGRLDGRGLFFDDFIFDGHTFRECQIRVTPSIKLVAVYLYKGRYERASYVIGQLPMWGAFTNRQYKKFWDWELTYRHFEGKE